jgi:hypothetical protein
MPFFDYVKVKRTIKRLGNKKGDKGLKEYWLTKNQQSIDGIATNIISKNL